MENLSAVYRLNQQVFDSCWSHQSLFSALESGYELIICKAGDELAGYLLSMTILDEMQIMQIAVDGRFLRQGLAEAMSRFLINSNLEAAVIFLEVRVSNRAARALYSKLGFEESGLRKSYYAPDATGMREDALLMELKLH